MKAVVDAFNQEKALVGAFSVIENLRMELFQALVLTVTTRSCDRVYDASHGRLLSPRWPSSVPRDTDCSFRVSAADPAATVSVYFRYFRVSTSANCSDNYLEVRDGPGQDTSPLLAKVRSRNVVDTSTLTRA